jgi:hypothetical protein
MKNVAQGLGLVLASALLGIPLAIFSGKPDWIIIWLVLVGWVTVWGIVSISSGIGDLLESRFMRRQFGDSEESEGIEIQTANRPAELTDPETSPNLKLPASVTENTTKLLSKPEP